MTDRELLELAARAAGLNLKWMDENPESNVKGGLVWGLAPCQGCGYPDSLDSCICDPVAYWNPLTDDALAFQLAVKLHIHIEWAFTSHGQPEQVQASPKGLGHCADIQTLGNDPCASVRRAITRAAAEIGRGMPDV